MAKNSRKLKRKKRDRFKRSISLKGFTRYSKWRSLTRGLDALDIGIHYIKRIMNLNNTTEALGSRGEKRWRVCFLKNGASIVAIVNYRVTYIVTIVKKN